jgi:hypothetical protein
LVFEHCFLAFERAGTFKTTENNWELMILLSKVVLKWEIMGIQWEYTL